MPFARNGTVKLHWESFGEGPAVLLVAGQGMTVDGWWATIPVLARSFRVIAFDNRDTGRSSRSLWPYSVAQMADDAVAVLDAAGEQQAHVYGISLGSLVAQEIALRHGDRGQALVLRAPSPRRLPPDRIATDIGHRLNSPPAPLAYMHQATAVATHDAYERLNQIAAPTL